MITRVSSVGVQAADLDQAVEFYVEKLGFEKLSDTPYGDGARWIEVAPPGATTPVALVLPREGDPTGIDLYFALTTTDIEADHAGLRERGVDSKPYLAAIHLTAFYRERFGHREGEFPVCEDVAARSLALPFYPELTEAQIERVATALREVLGQA